MTNLEAKNLRHGQSVYAMVPHAGGVCQRAATVIGKTLREIRVSVGRPDGSTMEFVLAPSALSLQQAKS